MVRDTVGPDRLEGIGHPALVVAFACAGLAVSTVMVLREPIPAAEVDVATWFNGAPDAAAVALHPVMQLGSLGGAFVVAVLIALLVRDRPLALATVAVALATWVLARAVKEMVERARPGAVVAGIDVRDSGASGFGFVSGHSSIAAAVAVMAVAALPSRWRPLPVLGAALTGIARMVLGVHFPADVLGGWSLGVLVGMCGLVAVDAVSGRSDVGAQPGTIS